MSETIGSVTVKSWPEFLVGLYGEAWSCISESAYDLLFPKVIQWTTDKLMSPGDQK